MVVEIRLQRVVPVFHHFALMDLPFELSATHPPHLPVVIGEVVEIEPLITIIHYAQDEVDQGFLLLQGGLRL